MRDRFLTCYLIKQRITRKCMSSSPHRPPIQASPLSAFMTMGSTMQTTLPMRNLLSVLTPIPHRTHQGPPATFAPPPQGRTSCSIDRMLFSSFNHRSPGGLEKEKVLKFTFTTLDYLVNPATKIALRRAIPPPSQPSFIHAQQPLHQPSTSSSMSSYALRRAIS